MSSLNLGKNKTTKNIITSLDTSTKNSNSIKSYGNLSKNYELNKSNSQCILPIIKTSKKNTIDTPASVLGRFINNHTSKIKNIMDNEISQKLNIKRKIFLPSRLKTRNINNNNIYKSQSLNDIYNNKNDISNSIGLFITEREKIIKNKNNNRVLSKIKYNKNNYNDKNNVGDELTNIKYITNENDDSFLNEKELNNINIQYSNLISDIGSGPLTPKYNDPLEIPKKDKKKNKDNNYSRLCRYEPKIVKNIKEKNSKSPFSNSLDFFQIYNRDIKYQSNIFDEQIKLFKDKLNEYKAITKRKNFIDIFKSISLDTKINYNKNLEEICGTLYILPKILLGNFYKLMIKLINIHIPHDDKLLPRFIKDEMRIADGWKMTFVEFSYITKFK